jgi:hypothetical protein
LQLLAGAVQWPKQPTILAAVVFGCGAVLVICSAPTARRGAMAEETTDFAAKSFGWRVARKL